MRFFGLKSCDTCRKALRQLADAGVEVSVTDVRADEIPSEDLKRFLDEFGDALVNRRSTTWRGLSESERAEPALDLLTRYPTLMKRPVIAASDGSMTVGWTAVVQEKLL